MPLPRCPAAMTSAHIALHANHSIDIFTDELLMSLRPVYIDFGPVHMSISEDQALELADALIRCTHHRRAAIAAMHAGQPDAEVAHAG